MKNTALKAITAFALICSVLMFWPQTATVAGIPVPRTEYYPGDSYTTVYHPTEILPPSGTEQPIITVTSPVNWSVSASNNLTLIFNLTLEASISYPITLDALCYELSWQPDNYSLEIEPHSPFIEKTRSFTINIANIPNGTHTITAYACTVCAYETSRELVREPVSRSGFIVGNFLHIYSVFYRTAGTSSVIFTIDPSANEQTTPLPSPPAEGLTTGLIIAAGTVVGVSVVVGLLLNFKKRKH